MIIFSEKPYEIKEILVRRVARAGCAPLNPPLSHYFLKQLSDSFKGYCCGTNEEPRCCVDYFDELEDLPELITFVSRFENVTLNSTIDFTESQVCALLTNCVYTPGPNETLPSGVSVLKADVYR